MEEKNLKNNNMTVDIKDLINLIHELKECVTLQPPIGQAAIDTLQWAIKELNGTEVPQRSSLVKEDKQLKAKIMREVFLIKLGVQWVKEGGNGVQLTTYIDQARQFNNKEAAVNHIMIHNFSWVSIESIWI